MKNNTSATISLWVTRLITVLVVLLCFFLYRLMDWYGSIRMLPRQVSMAIIVGFYLCMPGVLLALLSLERLLVNVLRQEIFIIDNVNRICRVRWCCAWVALVCLASGMLYTPLLFLAVIMAFLALIVTVVKNVMAAAVEIREENELTI